MGTDEPRGAKRSRAITLIVGDSMRKGPDVDAIEETVMMAVRTKSAYNSSPYFTNVDRFPLSSHQYVIPEELDKVCLMICIIYYHPFLVQGRCQTVGSLGAAQRHHQLVRNAVQVSYQIHLISDLQNVFLPFSIMNFDLIKPSNVTF